MATAKLDSLRQATFGDTPPQTVNLAEQNLIEDAKSAEEAARRVFPEFDSLDTTRQGVLVNMVFNLGPSGLAEFQSTLDAIRKGDFEGAADSMLKSKWARQVGPRAERLAERMRTGGDSTDNVSPHLAEIPQLKQDEGFSENPYMDTTGNLTVGYGRNLTSRGEVPHVSGEAPPPFISTRTPKLDALRVQNQSEELGWGRKVWDVFSQWAEETLIETPKTNWKGTQSALSTMHEIRKKHGVAKAWKYYQRGTEFELARMGVGSGNTDEELLELAEDIAIFQEYAPPQRISAVREFLNESFSGGVSDEEYGIAVKGTFDLASIITLPVSPGGPAAGTIIKGGFGALKSGKVLGQLLALEGDSIARGIVFETSRAMAFHEDKTDAMKRGFVWGAVGGMALPIGGMALKPVAKLAVKAVRAPIEVAAKPVGFLAKHGFEKGEKGLRWLGEVTQPRLERVLTKMGIYENARAALKVVNSHLTDQVILNGSMVLKKYGQQNILNKMIAIRQEHHILGGSWTVRFREIMVDPRKPIKLWRTRMFDADDPVVKGIHDLLHLDKNAKSEEVLHLLKVKHGLNEEEISLAVKKSFEIRANNKAVADLATEEMIPLDWGEEELRFFMAREDFGMPHKIVDTKQYIKEMVIDPVSGKEIRNPIRAEALSKIMKTDGIDRKAASAILEDIHAQNTAFIKAEDFKGFASIETLGRRYNLPGYVENFMEILPSYYGQMAKKIVNTKHLRPKEVRDAQQVLNPVNQTLEAAYRQRRGFEYQYPLAHQAVQAVQKSSGGVVGGKMTTEAKLVQNILKRQIGYIETGGAGAQLLGKFATLNIYTKLGLSQFTQFTQFAFPSIQTGYRGYYKDFMKAVKRDWQAEQFSIEAGATIESVMREAQMALMGGGQASTQKTLQKTGFTWMDTTARILGSLRGASMARHTAEDMVNLLKKPKLTAADQRRLKVLEGKFTELGIDPNVIHARGGHLVREELLIAAQKISTDNNFWADAISLPAFFKSPYGRVLTQFKSFAYQYTGLANKAVIKPLKDGNAEPLIRALIALGVTGEIVADAKALVKWRKRDAKGFDRFFENMISGGGLGIAFDVANSTNYRMGPLAMVAGPTVTGASDMLEITFGHSGPKKKARYVARNLAVINPFLPPQLMGILPIFSQWLQERLK